MARRRTMGNRRPILAGIAAGLLLFSLMLALIVALGSPAHAAQQLAQYGIFFVLLSAGFGAQVGLFLYLRALARCGARGIAASGGMSGLGMAACCAHHLVDVAAAVGIGAAVALLAAYQLPLLALGLVSNGLGLLHLARKLWPVSVLAHPLLFRAAALSGSLIILASIALVR